MEIAVNKRLFKKSDSTKLEITGGKPISIDGPLTVAGVLAQGTKLETVADPGDGNTITPPADKDFICTVDTAGAETRVLGTPDHVGQRGVIVFGTDMGNFTLANASGWLGLSASATATFDDSGDAILVEAVAAGAATDWRVVAYKGVSFGNGLVVVADPGAGQAIAPPADGQDFICTVDTVTGTETRSLGTPTRIGQKAYVVYGTDGGDDFTMTNASGWQDGTTTDDVATFDTSGDTAEFVALGTGAATDWRITAKKGVALG